VRTTRPRRGGIHLQPYLFVLPALLIFFVFTLLPVFIGFGLSFVNWNGFNSPAWVGWTNFANAFHDADFWQGVKHNAIFAIFTVVGKISLALGLAVLLNRRMPARTAIRTLFFLPVILSPIILGLVWQFLVYDYQIGMLNTTLSNLGLGRWQHVWLGTDTGLAALIVVDIWRWFGFHLVIYLAALQGIPADLYEAARIDGASPWSLFWRITLPLLRPVTAINVILATLGGFNLFDLVYIMTKGGPFNATNVAVMDIYTQAFQYNQFSYAAALSIILFGMVTALALVLLRLLRTERYF
jgi:ABC-type sugar transport system permease subunit